MPYRSRITEPVRPVIQSQQRDRDLFPVLFILWVPSAFRVVVALMHHETFRAQATLALIFAALIPCLAVWPWIQRSRLQQGLKVAPDVQRIGRSRRADSSS